MSRSGWRVLAAASVLAANAAQAADAPVPAAATGCAAPPELLVIEPALGHAATRIERGDKLTIVAVGSSSTEGVGASGPSFTYPSRLQAMLAKRFPDAPIRVINRGKGGEDAPEELARLDRDVIAERPDLVIWQLGTNAVLRRDDPVADGEQIERGVAKLRRGPSDVVLMDMQYAPRVIARPAYATMRRLLADTAKRARIGLFRRFDIMRHWHEAARPGAPPMIGPDGLHMTDRGYDCLALGLAEALARNWRRHQRAMPFWETATVADIAGGRPSPASDGSTAQ